MEVIFSDNSLKKETKFRKKEIADFNCGTHFLSKSTVPFWKLGRDLELAMLMMKPHFWSSLALFCLLLVIFLVLTEYIFDIDEITEKKCKNDDAIHGWLVRSQSSKEYFYSLINFIVLHFMTESPILWRRSLQKSNVPILQSEAWPNNNHFLNQRELLSPP